MSRLDARGKENTHGLETSRVLALTLISDCALIFRGLPTPYSYYVLILYREYQ